MEEQKANDWEKVTTPVWKFEKGGDFIEGVLIDKIMVEKDEGSNRYFVENKQGIKLIWGSAIIDDRMRFVDVGTEIKITFIEKKDIGAGKTLNIFEIERRKKDSRISFMGMGQVPEGDRMF